MSQEVDPVVKSSARWFWWIAGLSLVNAIMLMSGSDVNFVIGLAMTTLAAVLFQSIPALAIVVVGITVAFYFAMGYFAQQRKLWAFYVGLGVYAVDALIYLGFQDWMPVAFHLLAGYFIYKGVAQLRQTAAANSG